MLVEMTKSSKVMVRFGWRNLHVNPMILPKNASWNNDEQGPESACGKDSLTFIAASHFPSSPVGCWISAEIKPYAIWRCFPLPTIKWRNDMKSSFLSYIYDIDLYDKQHAHTYITLHYGHYITLRYITLYNVTLHKITLHCITLHTYIYVQ